jgi:hypothetical protein
MKIKMRSNGVRIENMQLTVATFLLHVFNAPSHLLSEMQVIAFHLQSYLLQLLQQKYIYAHTLAFSEARVSVCVCVSTGAMMMMIKIIIIKMNFK